MEGYSHSQGTPGAPRRPVEPAAWQGWGWGGPSSVLASVGFWSQPSAAGRAQEMGHLLGLGIWGWNQGEGRSSPSSCAPSVRQPTLEDQLSLPDRPAALSEACGERQARLYFPQTAPAWEVLKYRGTEGNGAPLVCPGWCPKPPKQAASSVEALTVYGALPVPGAQPTWPHNLQPCLGC